MSRIGNLPIKLPAGVTAEMAGNEVVVKGPKGELSRKVHRSIAVETVDGQVLVKNTKNENYAVYHGSARSHLFNMIKGVSEGWTKELEMVGTGYRPELKGDKLVLLVGFSHPVELSIPEGVSVTLDKTKIAVSGIDKEKVGHFSALVRQTRPPEPYKGKGIKYVDEKIRRKAGKAAKGSEGE